MNLEHELRLLDVAFPPEPDLRARVLAQIERPAPRRRLALAIALAALAVAGALMAIPQTRAAILRFLEIGGVRIERVETQPRAPAAQPDLGERVTLEEARDAVEIELAVPRTFRAVYVDDDFVTFIVRRGVFLTQWGGRGPPLLYKEAGPGTDIRDVGVEGTVGLWITGARHVVLRGPERRSAANVLIWERGDVTYRLEGALTLEDALDIVADLRRR